MVVRMVGLPINVVATVYGLLGNRGVFVLAVILLGGYGCIAAYFVGPVCIAQGRAKLPVAPFDGELPTSFCVGGPSVPVTDCIPVMTFWGKVPVMPLREKRGEKFVIVPPDVLCETILKKYAFAGVLAPKVAAKVPSAVFPLAKEP